MIINRITVKNGTELATLANMIVVYIQYKYIRTLTDLIFLNYV